VLSTMPREEGDRAAPHLAHRQRSGWLPVRGIDLDLVHPLEERVEPRSSEDPDVGRGQADFSLLTSCPFGSFFFSSFFLSFSPSPGAFDEAGDGLRESVA
jgi:hypothetical protein